jgi:hypothetical protein
MVSAEKWEDSSLWVDEEGEEWGLQLASPVPHLPRIARVVGALEHKQRQI